MPLTKAATLAVASSFAIVVAAAARSPQIADLAARVSFGYYDGDAHVIEAAHAELARLGDDADARYYRAFAAWRLAQLASEQRRPSGAWTDECVATATPEKAAAAAAPESWLLVAACLQTAARAEPGKPPARDRRREQALARARETAAGNPRLALIEALEISDRPALAEPAARAAAVDKLRAAVAAFASRPTSLDGPDWGEAEALALLGEAALAQGEARAARDAIERALLLAPDYRFALELRAKLQAAARP